MKLKNIFLAWMPVLVWCAVIFTLSSIPTPQTSQIYWWDFAIKKTAHMVEYGILYFLFFRAVIYSENKSSITNYSLLITFLFGLLYAFSDEIHQSFTPGRHPKLMDIGFDSLGMLISFYLIKFTDFFKSFPILNR